MITLVYVAVFLAALLLVSGFTTLLTDMQAGKGAANRRMRLLAEGKGSKEVLSALKRRRDEPNATEAQLMELAPMAALDRLIQAAGGTVPTLRFAAFLGGATVLVTLILSVVLFMAPWKALLMAPLISIALPVLVLRRKAKKRTAALVHQLPEAVDMIVRSLKAGHPVSGAIALVAQEMEDPLGSEFGMVFDEMTYGLDLREALENMAKRNPVPELHYLVVAVRIQYGTGGNLAEVLAGLSRVLRERVKMNQRIKALSAEGRLSAVILSLLPFVLAGIIHMMNPTYYPDAMKHSGFITLMSIGLAGVVAGAFTMHRMVNFRF